MGERFGRAAEISVVICSFDQVRPARGDTSKHAISPASCVFHAKESSNRAISGVACRALPNVTFEHPVDTAIKQRPQSCSSDISCVHFTIPAIGALLPTALVVQWPSRELLRIDHIK